MCFDFGCTKWCIIRICFCRHSIGFDYDTVEEFSVYLQREWVHEYIHRFKYVFSVWSRDSQWRWRQSFFDKIMYCGAGQYRTAQTSTREKHISKRWNWENRVYFYFRLTYIWSSLLAVCGCVWVCGKRWKASVWRAQLIFNSFEFMEWMTITSEMSPEMSKWRINHIFSSYGRSQRHREQLGTQKKKERMKTGRIDPHMWCECLDRSIGKSATLFVHRPHRFRNTRDYF